MRPSKMDLVEKEDLKILTFQVLFPISLKTFLVILVEEEKEEVEKPILEVQT